MHPMMTHSWMHSIPSAKKMVHIKEHRGMDSQGNTGVWTKTLERRSKTVAEEDLLIVTNSHHQMWVVMMIWMTNVRECAHSTMYQYVALMERLMPTSVPLRLPIAGLMVPYA